MEGDRLRPDVWAEVLDLAAAARAIGDECVRTQSSPNHREFTDRLALLAADADGAGLTAVYLRLVEAMARGPLTIGQLGQTLDGRIATYSGHSRYINGSESLDHLHRLRALVDAVIVGASTVHLDDPQLTTRRVDGANPVRVVIDPHRRLSPAAQVFDGRAPTLILVGDDDASHPAAASSQVQVVVVQARKGEIDPGDILACLRERGLRIVLVEGGARTVSLFLRHRRLDRLHIAVAPLLLGSGTAAITLPPVAHMDDAMRLVAQPQALGADILFDCQLA